MATLPSAERIPAGRLPDENQYIDLSIFVNMDNRLFSRKLERLGNEVSGVDFQGFAKRGERIEAGASSSALEVRDVALVDVHAL